MASAFSKYTCILEKFVVTYIVYLFQIYFLFVSSYFPAKRKKKRSPQNVSLFGGRVMKNYVP